MELSKSEFDEKLNKLQLLLQSENFKKSIGLANEVPFYIFDYPISFEEYVVKFINKLEKNKSLDNLIVINLFYLLNEHLKNEGIIGEDRNLIFEKEKKSGTNSVIVGLRSTFNVEIATDLIRDKSVGHNTVIITGIGSVLNIISPESLFSNLQHKLKSENVVFMFPGIYTKERIIPLGIEEYSANYYRAFKI